MKRVKKPVFFVVLVLICALVFTSLFGLYGQNGDFKIGRASCRERVF